jgi:hypothetical protein
LAKSLPVFQRKVEGGNREGVRRGEEEEEEEELEEESGP